MCIVSIIIPVFNCANSLSLCIDSILAQTYKKLDVLLIDDGSNDGSFEICTTLKKKDPRIRVFHHENHGVSFTRNVGIKNAVGDYIMFVDADDVVLPDMIEKYLSATNQGNADIIIGGLIFNYNGNKDEKLPPKDADNPERAISYVVQGYRGIFGYVSNKMYRKDLLLKNHIQFPETIVNQEDLLFFVAAVDSAEYVKIIQYAGYIYDISGGEKTASFITLIANQIKVIGIASKYQSIDITPAKRRIGRLLVDGLLESKNELSIKYIKDCLLNYGISEYLDPRIMDGKKCRIIVWMAKHRLYYPLFLYMYLG